MDGVVFVIVAIGIYFLPGIIAHARDHHQENAIVLLNLFLGWTLLGWVIALVWSAMAVEKGAIAPKSAPSSGDTKVCPYCAETIKTDAIACRYCGRDLERKNSSASGQPDREREQPTDAQQMEEYGIVFDGERYSYGEHRYEKLADAISYAKRQNKRV